MEVNGQEHMGMKVEEISDYPPRIHVDLVPKPLEKAPQLKVVGLKNECFFKIAHKCK